LRYLFSYAPLEQRQQEFTRRAPKLSAVLVYRNEWGRRVTLL
jgi:hypothetical protein